MQTESSHTFPSVKQIGHPSCITQTLLPYLYMTYLIFHLCDSKLTARHSKYEPSAKTTLTESHEMNMNVQKSREEAASSTVLQQKSSACNTLCVTICYNRLTEGPPR
jgi:hypothetical protein